MTGRQDQRYDAIIAGAGIAGLICGCYLARAGLRVLIAEYGRQPGGYCTSFSRKGFVFDSAIHSLGSCRADGLIGTVMREMDLGKKLRIIRKNPSDTVIFANGDRFCFYDDIRQTTESLAAVFPREKESIYSFLEFMRDASVPDLFLKLRYHTFDALLGEYFKTPYLRSVLSGFLGNFHLPAHKASAVSCALLYKEFIIDGGYYPAGGMQKFSDALAETFTGYGGTLRCDLPVEKILVEDGRVTGVTARGTDYFSTYVISGADARQTYLRLVGPRHVPRPFRDKITGMVPTTSAFVVYLALDSAAFRGYTQSASTWCFTEEDTNGYFDALSDHRMMTGGYVLLASPSSHDESMAPKGRGSLQLLVGMPYRGEAYWRRHKEKIADTVVKTAERFVPGLSKAVTDRYLATPHTFYKYTLNHKGAFRGWQATPGQIRPSLVSQKSFIKNLFLTGHWNTQPGQGGVPTVAYASRALAMAIAGDGRDT